MHEFVYRAADAGGQPRQGRVAASSESAALQQLRRDGLTPIRLNEATPTRPSTLPDLTSPGAAAESATPPTDDARHAAAHRKAVPMLCAELATLLQAGLPLARALSLLQDVQDPPGITTLAQRLSTAVKRGDSLSAAMVRQSALFDDFLISVVRAGEAGGRLGDALGEVSAHLDRRQALRDRLVSAVTYPLILLVVALLSVALMLGFVVPQFEPLFADVGDALPWPTAVLLGLSQQLAAFGVPLLIALLVFGVLVRRWATGSAGRHRLHAAILRLPVIGGIVRGQNRSRFAHSLGTLLANGVPLVSALRIASDTVDNLALRHALAPAADTLKGGARLAEALAPTGLMTPLALNMIRLGEETGQLSMLLRDFARLQDTQLEHTLKRGLTLIEPVLILSMGALVAGIMAAILLGVLSVNELAL